MAKYTYKQFIQAHKGKALDYDGVAGCQCFTKNHFVLMEDYTYKAIQDIEIGDRVIGYDGKINNVIQVHKHQANNLVFARILDLKRASDIYKQIGFKYVNFK